MGDALGRPITGLTPYEVQARFHSPIDGYHPGNGPAGSTTIETTVAMSSVAALKGSDKCGETEIGSINSATASAWSSHFMREYAPSDGAATVYSKIVPISLWAAATGAEQGVVADCCRRAAVRLTRTGCLASFLFADMIRELVRNANELSKPYELYDADTSLLSRMIKIASKSEARFPADDTEDRLSERLVFVRKELTRSSDLPQFFGKVGRFGGVAEALAVSVFCYMRSPDDFLTVRRTISMGGAASIHGAMVGAMVGATVGSSLLPQHMKDDLAKGLTIETAGIELAEACMPEQAEHMEEEVA